MVGPIGPLATINREPGQVRKEAAVAVVLCAGVWLVGFTSSLLPAKLQVASKKLSSLLSDIRTGKRCLR